MSNAKIKLIELFAVMILLYGAVATPSFLWDIVDLGVALLAIINTIVILLLREDVIRELGGKNDR